MTTSDAGYSLAHPVYLDVPMMTSFLAHLEGGVALSEEETTKSSGARERLLKGRAGVKAKLWAVAEGDLSSEGSTQNRDETSSESKTERHHTAASLFNLLYYYLKEDAQLIDLTQPDQLTVLRSGQLVELSGEYLGNPLEEVLTFFGSMLSYMDVTPADVAPGVNASARRSAKPAKPATASAPPSVSSARKAPEADPSPIQLLLKMSADIVQSPVHDLLFLTGDELKAVITVNSEYYSATTNEYLRAGEFRVVGKVTRVLKDDMIINLTRRTVLGAAGPEVAQDLITSANSGDMSLNLADAIVRSPAVQILPMANFV